MLIVMQLSATTPMVQDVLDRVAQMGHTAHQINGLKRTVVAVGGNGYPVNCDNLRTMPGVDDIIQVTQPYKLVSREKHPEDSVIEIGDVRVGRDRFAVMAGPCSVESRDQSFRIAESVAQGGARIFRGGAFKPRTSPYSFQGLGEDGLKILAEVREQFGLLIVTEAVDTETLDLVAEYADIVQIGARNMQNYSLLKRAGRINKPVLLKRGMWATIEEFLMSAEYILAEGNQQVILCERGIRTSANHNGHVLDLSSIPYIKQVSHLPVICDPSHGSGERYKVAPLSRAALAAGADGLLIEVHHEPQDALSDGPQAITTSDYAELMDDLKKMAVILNRICI